MEWIFTAYTLYENETPTASERAYIALFGGHLHEVVGIAPDGHIDTAFGNSEFCAIENAIKNGLQPL